MYINDPIHGLIEITPLAKQIIDTPEFQRLRYIKQLGLSSYVYPSATHTRFEHSLGVYHLAKLVVKDELISIAGLCHDLGHGPLSHTYEHWLRRKGINFNHEEMSLKVLDKLIDNNGIDIDGDDLKYIKRIMIGDGCGIICNKSNSLDVDKLDYISRDGYMTGIDTYRPERIIRFMKLINDDMYFPAKDAYNIYELYHTRYRMFKTVYTHRVCRAIEYMVFDILDKVDVEFGISSAIDDIDRYIKLNDNILYVVELKYSSLFDRLRRRNIYKLVKEYIDNVDNSVDLYRKDDRYIIDEFTLDYGLGNKNPLEYIKFIDKYNNLVKPNILLPSKFIERYVRVYSR
jgi:HD superfamily phosphohydrolase